MNYFSSFFLKTIRFIGQPPSSVQSFHFNIRRKLINAEIVILRMQKWKKFYGCDVPLKEQVF